MKMTLLTNTRQQLKEEFSGIDQIIDQVIDSVTPWYLFPGLQDRPTIVNLWGLTGVGKSSLVTRIAGLLDFEKQYFRFDLGEAFDREHSIKRKLMTLFPRSSGIPMILAFDEFQHARTLDQTGKELDKGFLRVIWEIMDSGKFSMNYSTSIQQDLPQFISVFSLALSNGVSVQNGQVVSGAEYFNALKTGRGSRHDLYKAVNDQNNAKQEKVYFLDTYLIEQLFIIAQDRFESEVDLRDYLDTLDGPQTVEFLKKLYKHSLAHQFVDCSRALVFVMGNLDEAYHMSSNLNPDISADQFHRQSLKINLSTIKNALCKRFRSEQIARLGNTHIIYPALSEAAYYRIIGRELDKLKVRAASVGLDLSFDHSIFTLIYQEGVFPTQGVRPLFTTLHQLVGTRLSKIMCEKVLLPEPSNALINLRWSGLELIIEFIQDGTVVRQVAETLNLALGKLRQSTHDDLQAITAVHEAGHAIVSMALLGIVPSAVYSVTADDGSAGFTYNENDVKFIARHEILARLAVILGGMAAEEAVFGQDRVTTGAMGDLKQATELVNRLIMESGLGDTVGHYQYAAHAMVCQLPTPSQLISRAQLMLDEAYQMALTTLTVQEVWLMKLADFLSDHTQIAPPELIAMAARHAVDIDVSSFQKDTNNLFYRKHLKQRVKNLDHQQRVLQLVKANGVNHQTASEKVW